MNKSTRYQSVLKQLDKLLPGCENPVSRMSTIAALLHHKMEHFFWTGFYLLDDVKLFVGPYQGSLACLNLKKDTGVCWAAISQCKSIVVPNVHEFPGHIACDSRSNSEIVVPVFNLNNTIIGVLDIDSREFSNFDETDVEFLEKIVKHIYKDIVSIPKVPDYFNEIENQVTICDAVGKMLYMNQKSIEIFEGSGGIKLMGSNIYACHPGESYHKFKQIMDAQKSNTYFTLKNGNKKLVQQIPWFIKQKFGGFIEISIPITDSIQTFDRK
jgi:GAF domain-containing protein